MRGRSAGVVVVSIVMVLLMTGVSAVAWAVMTEANGPVQVRDATGRLVRLPAPARRVVSLSPHLTELLFAAGAGEWLVGVAEYSDYPPTALRLPTVSGAGRLDLERIVALRPDLVVAWGGGLSSAQLERLRHLGLVVYVSEPHLIPDIAAELRRLGQLVGTESTANAAAADFLTELAALRVQYSARPAVTVFYQVWGRPLVTLGSEHLVSRVIELCGGRNVFAEGGGLAPTVSIEAVLVRDPEVIVASGMDAHRPAWLEDWRAWPRLVAVRQDNLFDIPPSLIQRYTPRLLAGARMLCGALEVARHKRLGLPAR